MALTYESDLDKVKMDHRVKWVGQRLYRLTVIVWTHRHTNSSPTAAPGPDHKNVGNND